MKTVAVTASLLLVWATPAPPVHGATREAATVEAAVAVLDQIMSVPVRSIPASLLADANGLAIIPDVLKGGFVIGARRGKGVVLTRDRHGNWQPPAFVTLTGGSVGWQIGVQSTDVILVFKTPKSVEGLLQGKFTIGADAAVAAGPLGRQAAAATDQRLKAEIYSYCRSRGLFAGVAIDGSVLQIDRAASAAFYRPAFAGDRAMMLPPSALKLLARVAHYTQTDVGHPHMENMEIEQVPAPMTPLVNDAAAGRPDHVRLQLARASLELSALLDDDWNRHLALPGEVFDERGHPSVASLQVAARRYNAIAENGRYRTLSMRKEYRTVHRLLEEYVRVLEPTQTQGPLALPRPPAPALPGPMMPRR